MNSFFLLGFFSLLILQTSNNNKRDCSKLQFHSIFIFFKYDFFNLSPFWMAHI